MSLRAQKVFLSGSGLAGAVLGAAFFIAIYGTWILNPGHIQWLLHGDPAQHYLGFAFYRNEPWSWPLGKIAGYGTPVGTTVVFTDSIPLLAIAFKLFNSILPQDFQYFGGWMLVCYALQGAFAERLLARCGLDGLAVLLGTLLLVMSPALAWRAYGHESLMAHWLLLAAFDACLARRPQRLAPLWCLGALIHAYWIALLAPFVLLAWVRRGLGWRHRVLWLAGIALAMTAAGYFMARPSQLAAVGYGQYSANLLSLIDPLDWRAFLMHFGRPVDGSGEWSRLLPAQGQAQVDQYEGFAYLGAGTLLLILFATVSMMFRAQPGSVARARTLWPLLLIAVLMFIYALSTRITLGAMVVFDPPLPAWLLSVLGIFRATGRFAWPLALLLPIWACVHLAGVLSRKNLALPLIVALALQAWDLSAKWGEFSNRFAEGQLGARFDFQDPAWQAAAPMQKLLVLPRLTGDEWIEPALFAARRSQSINLGLISRVDEQAQARAESRAVDALLTAQPEDQTAYWIRDPALCERLAARLGSQMQLIPFRGGLMVVPRHGTVNLR